MQPWFWRLLLANLVVGLVCSCVLGDLTPLLIGVLGTWSCWRLSRWLE
jgi:hypothetical protein